MYIKVPFINEVLKQRTQAVIKRSGIQNIKVHYMTGRPLSSIFRPPKEQQKCPEACETCTSAKKVNKCLSKNCVYIIECTHCHLVYVGETSRTVGSRIKEHARKKNKLFISILLVIPIRQCLKTSHGTFYITTFHNIRHARSLKRSISERKTLKPS